MTQRAKDQRATFSDTVQVKQLQVRKGGLPPLNVPSIQR